MATTKILANRHYASYQFGAENPGQFMTSLPRMKFMFYAEFIPNGDAATLYPWLKELGTTQGISFKIKTVDKPNVELNVKELNQYNRKRYAYTKTEYKPVNITIYDTVDNKPLDVWRQYFTYYFGDARPKSSLTMGQSPVDGNFDDATGWGLRPLSEQVNFFTRLDLYAFHGKKYTLISYLNPKITAMNWQNYDMTDSGVEEASITLSYETLAYYSQQDINSTLAEKFGFDVAPDVPDPNQNEAGAIQLGSTSDPYGVFSQQTGQLPGQATDRSVSVDSASGMNPATWYRLVGNPAQATRTGMGRNQSNQYTVSSAAGAYDNIRYDPPGSAAWSNRPMSPNSGILGVASGQLPVFSQALPLATSVLTNIGPEVGGTLSNSGMYNFGMGGIPYGPRYNNGFGPGNSYLNRQSYNGVSIQSPIVPAIQVALAVANASLNNGYGPENAVANTIDTVVNAVADGIDILSDVLDI